MAGEIHRITQETLDKLQAEYDELTTVGRTEIARVIESARLLGDLSENGDYHAAKDSQGKMESRIRQIDNVIRNHEIVERDENSHTVEHATIVQIIYEGDGDEDRSQIGLSSSAGDLRREIQLALGGEALERHSILLPSGDALVPRLLGRRRSRGWPIAVRPFELFLVVRIHDEIEQVVLGDSNVLEQLPHRVRETGRSLAAELWGKSPDRVLQ